MPSPRTTVTELGTALGTLGCADIDEAIGSQTPVMRSISPEVWEHLATLRSGAAYDTEFHAAWENGRAFLGAADGLRGRLPNVVEWKGTGRAPGDEVAPIDLRIDHVYLVSCKYLSNILFNVSPAHIFDYLLIAGQSRAGRAAREVLPGGGDWYAQVAPSEYQALYEEVRRALRHLEEDDATLIHRTPRGPAPVRRGSVGPASGAVSLPGLGEHSEGGRHSGPDPASAPVPAPGPAPVPAVLHHLPDRAVDLTSEHRDALGRWLGHGWPPGAKDLYARLSDAVARASARRWEAAMDVGGGAGEAMVWRLLRIGSAPYFVLGSAAARSLRLRIATSWDWRQQYQLVSVAIEPQSGGQPRVGWEAVVRDRSSHVLHAVTGHIEVRWSHGRFGGLPEAKGYLDTPHHLVPGYFTLR
jgi:hypothetical protein